MITITSAPQFYPTKPARTQLRVVQREQAPLTTAEKERIVAEQQQINRRAIQRFHDEGGLRRFAETALRVAPPTRTIEFWQGDAPAIRAALVALADITLLVNVLIDADAVSDVAADAFDARLAIIGCALE